MVICPVPAAVTMVANAAVDVIAILGQLYSTVQSKTLPK